MPTYEYACTACGTHLEAVQKFTDDPLTTCPHCGGPLRKVFGSIGIVLKGSGFYRNDSRSNSDGRARSAKSKDSGGTDSSSASTDTASTPTGSGSSEGGGAATKAGDTTTTSKKDAASAG